MNWDAAVREALGEPALTALAWGRGADPSYVVYAFPSRRVATLRHWRDEVETPELVGFEASKWARLLLKGHGGALLSCATSPDHDPMRMGPTLAALATELWTADATEWARRIGVEPIVTTTATVHGGDRFERVERWLTAVRAWVDATDLAATCR